MINQSKNAVILCGTPESNPIFSHESHGERFLTFPILVKRLSQTADRINVLVNETLISNMEITPGDFIRISGELRSFNNKSGSGSKLIITAYAKEIEPFEPIYANELELTGVICKNPIYRKTPLGREICDLMLAINRRYGRADYLPCIAWGRNAYSASQLAIGTTVSITGRIQSRNYIKVMDGVEYPKTTYEVSVSTIDKNPTE